MPKKLTIKEFDLLDQNKKSDYLNTLNFGVDDDNPILLALKKRFIEEHGKTGRLEEVFVNASLGLFPASLIVRVNRKSGKTRIPSNYHGLWVRKWYKYESKK